MNRDQLLRYRDLCVMGAVGMALGAAFGWYTVVFFVIVTPLIAWIERE